MFGARALTPRLARLALGGLQRDTHTTYSNRPLHLALRLWLPSDAVVATASASADVHDGIDLQIYMSSSSLNLSSTGHLWMYCSVGDGLDVFKRAWENSELHRLANTAPAAKFQTLQ